MTVADAGPSGRDPQARRYPCPWCERAEAWPDRCSESHDAPEDAYCCNSMIEKQCMRGDHRRCAIGACTVSSRWHEPVREAGTAAACVAGTTWAIVSTIGGDVEVTGTARHLGQAKLLRRNTLLNAGHLDDAEGRGLVYVVRGADGGFL